MSGYKNYKRRLRWKGTIRKHGMAHGLIPCPYCGGDIQDDRYGHRLVCANCRRSWPTKTDAEYNRTMQQLHPGNLDTRDCPECGSKMHWRDAAGLTGMHPEGAWECSNQSCWHMAPPGEMMPDTYQDPDAPGDFTLPEDWKQSAVNSDPEYTQWYNRGWRYANYPSATLEHGDNLRVPDAWYDGYLDRAAGREKWHLPNCTGCPEHPDRAPQ